MTVEISRLAFSRDVFTWPGENSRIDPATTRGRAIRLEIAISSHELAILQCAAIDLLQDFLNHGFLHGTLCRVVPSKGIEPSVPRPRIPARSFLQTAAQVIHEPGLAAGVAGRIDRLLVKLVESLRVCEAATFF